MVGIWPSVLDPRALFEGGAQEALAALALRRSERKKSSVAPSLSMARCR